MIIRILLSALFFLPVSLLVNFIGYFVVAFMLYVKADMSLSWWGNRDHPDNGGTFWKKKCGDSFWCAYQWFALRNPAFNFGKYFCGYVSKGKSVCVAGSDDKNIGDKKREGWYYAREGWRWEIYAIKKYSLFGNQKCFRFRCGWKMAWATDGDRCAICFVVSPFHSYSGI
jgi:hypothetical protein